MTSNTNENAASDVRALRDKVEALAYELAECKARERVHTQELQDLRSKLGWMPGGPRLQDCGAKRTSDTAAAGRELLSLLRHAPTPARSSRAPAEPQCLSSCGVDIDEMLLMRMEAREDAEGGADLWNLETFGGDALGAWSVAENIKANDQLTQHAAAAADSAKNFAILLGHFVTVAGGSLAGANLANAPLVQPALNCAALGQHAVRDGGLSAGRLKSRAPSALRGCRRARTVPARRVRFSDSIITIPIADTFSWDHPLSRNETRMLVAHLEEAETCLARAPSARTTADLLP